MLVCTARVACCGDTAMDVPDPKHTIAGARLMRLANPLPERGNGFACLGFVNLKARHSTGGKWRVRDAVRTHPGPPCLLRFRV